MKYAAATPQDFIPNAVFQKFPQLRTEYKAIINSNPLSQDLISSNHATVQSAIEELKDLLVHSFVVSQQNNWIFITQVEAYYHDKDVDDVAQVDKIILKNYYSIWKNVKKARDPGMNCAFIARKLK